MPETIKSRNWKFKIENFGSIDKGEIGISPLTLLCGPNNTGKTWAMYVLYGFLHNSMPLSWLKSEIFTNLMKKLQTNGSYQWPFKEWLIKHGDSLIQKINMDMKHRMPRIFNVSEDTFQGSKFQWTIQKMDLVQDAIARSMQQKIRYGDERNYLELLKENGGQFVRCSISGGDDPSFFVYTSLFRHLINCQKVFLMPAERNGLNLFYQELSSSRAALLHHASLKEINLEELLRDVIEAPYALPIAHYINWLNKLPRAKKGDGKFHEVAKQITKLARGVYVVDKKEKIQFRPRKLGKGSRKARSMGLHMSGSAAKSLFGLWFYLEHQAEPGDVLMIDEPELNLHPESQRTLARIFTRLVNKGMYIVISTHSDYLLREINRLIMFKRAHPKREQLLAKYKLEEIDTIDAGMVTAYLANKRRIQPMKIDEEGIVGDTFDDVIKNQNKESNDLYYAYRAEKE